MRRCLLAGLIALATLMTAAPLQAQTRSLGAHFTLVNAYIYTGGPVEGQRFVARARRSFPVTDFQQDSRDQLWLRIIFTDFTRKVRGEGWTAKLPHELLPTEREPILVFSAPLAKDDASINSLRIPANSLSLLNDTLDSPYYKRVVWQKVKYELEQPIEAWIRESSGVFRPGKSPDFLVRTYGEMVTRDVEKNKLLRLLGGVVHLGDVPADVEWALGTPLRKQEESLPEAQRTTWEYPELVIRFENGIVKQVN